MSDVAMELLSVTLTRAPLGLKLDAYGFLAAVLDTAEDATRRALRPCDELIGINGTLYDDIPTESTPDAAAELCDLVGEYVEAGAFPLTLTFRRDPSLMCQPVSACFERRSAPRRSSSAGPRRRRTWRSTRSPKRRRTLTSSPSPIYASQTSSSSLSSVRPPGDDELVFESPGAAFAPPDDDAAAFAPPRDDDAAAPPPDDAPPEGISEPAVAPNAAVEEAPVVTLDDAPPEDHISEPAVAPDAAVEEAPVVTTTRRRKKPRRYAEVPDAPASRWAEGSAVTPAPITPAAPPPITPAAPAAPVPPVTLSAGAAPAAPPPRTPAAPVSGAAAAAAGPTVFTKRQILALMPGGTGSIVPAVYAASGTIYALCFSEASNPGLPTVLEISAGAQRARQVALLDGLRQSGGVAPLFVCLRTRRGRLECMPGSSCKAFRFAGYRPVVSVERHDPPKLVGGEGRQATVTLGAATATPCPLTATPAAAPPATPAAPPPVLSPVTSPRRASPFLPPAPSPAAAFASPVALSPAPPPPVPGPTRRRAIPRRYADVPADVPASRWAEPPAAATAPAEPSSSTDDGSDESDDDSSLEDSLPPLPEPDRVSSASTISAVEVGL